MHEWQTRQHQAEIHRQARGHDAPALIGLGEGVLLFLLTGVLGLAILWGWRRYQEGRGVESSPLAFFGVVGLTWTAVIVAVLVAL